MSALSNALVLDEPGGGGLQPVVQGAADTAPPITTNIATMINHMVRTNMMRFICAILPLGCQQTSQIRLGFFKVPPPLANGVPLSGLDCPPPMPRPMPLLLSPPPGAAKASPAVAKTIATITTATVRTNMMRFTMLSPFQKLFAEGTAAVIYLAEVIARIVVLTAP
jgi:hypothetical protein